VGDSSCEGLDGNSREGEGGKGRDEEGKGEEGKGGKGTGEEGKGRDEEGKGEEGRAERQRQLPMLLYSRDRDTLSTLRRVSIFIRDRTAIGYGNRTRQHKVQGILRIPIRWISPMN
jgi:hypothetical protein